MELINYSLLCNFDGHNPTKLKKEKTMKYVHIFLYRLYGRMPHKPHTGFNEYLKRQKAKNEEILRAELFKFSIADYDKKS